MTVECLRCRHVGVLTGEAPVAPGDHAQHADRRVRQAPALPQVRKPQRARDTQAGAAAATGVLMCGRFTVKMTWAEIVALYKLTLDRPPHNLPPSYNVCPTDPIDVVTSKMASAT